MSFDDSGPSSSQTLLTERTEITREPCNTIESETDEVSDPEDITLQPCQPQNEYFL